MDSFDMIGHTILVRMAKISRLFEVPVNSTWHSSEDGRLICPAIASDYFGGYGHDEQFARQNAQYGARYSERQDDR